MKSYLWSEIKKFPVVDGWFQGPGGFTCKVGPDAVVGSDAVVGRGAVVGSGAWVWRDARVERVKEISEADAEAEGFESDTGDYAYDRFTMDWQSRFPGSWERNEWVWVMNVNVGQRAGEGKDDSLQGD